MCPRFWASRPWGLASRGHRPPDDVTPRFTPSKVEVWLCGPGNPQRHQSIYSPVLTFTLPFFWRSENKLRVSPADVAAACFCEPQPPLS